MLFYQECICADVASKTCFLDLLGKRWTLRCTSMVILEGLRGFRPQTQ